jgi:hypothetical protein
LIRINSAYNESSYFHCIDKISIISNCTTTCITRNLENLILTVKSQRHWNRWIGKGHLIIFKKSEWVAWSLISIIIEDVYIIAKCSLAQSNLKTRSWINWERSCRRHTTSVYKANQIHCYLKLLVHDSWTICRLAPDP